DARRAGSQSAARTPGARFFRSAAIPASDARRPSRRAGPQRRGRASRSPWGARTGRAAASGRLSRAAQDIVALVMNASEPLPEVSAMIAVVGMAGRFPQAGRIDEFWKNLCGGRECLSGFTAAELRMAGVPEALLA